MDTLKSCWFSKILNRKSRVVPIQIHGQSELHWVSSLKKKKKEQACFQGSHFMCVGEGRVVVKVVCVAEFEVCRELQSVEMGFFFRLGLCVFGVWVDELVR